MRGRERKRPGRSVPLREIPFDPALSRYFASKLVQEGLPLVEIRQAPLFRGR